MNFLQIGRGLAAGSWSPEAYRIERQRWSFTEEYNGQAVELVSSSRRSVTSETKGPGLRDAVLRRSTDKLRWEPTSQRGAPPRGRRRCRLTRPWRSPGCARRTTGGAWSATLFRCCPGLCGIETLAAYLRACATKEINRFGAKDASLWMLSKERGSTSRHLRSGWTAPASSRPFR